MNGPGASVLGGLTSASPALKRPVVVALAVALCGTSVIAISIDSAYAGAILFSGALFLVVVAKIVFGDFVTGVLAYTVLIVLEEFCKRLVFLLPDQSPTSQYAVFVPAYLALAVLLVKAVLQQRLRLDGQGRLFILFLLLAFASTWLNPRISFLPKAIGSAWIVCPYVSFLIWRAAAESADFPRRFARLIANLAFVAALLGLYQLVTGPTFVDRSWAIHTHEFSIQGQKIFAFLCGLTSSFRIFSLCADHFAFAYLLIAGLVGYAVLHELGEPTTVPTALGVPILLGTLVASLCRTAWICAVLIPVLFLALRYGPSLRGRSLLAGLLAGYFVAAVLTSALYEMYHVQEQAVAGSAFARRALATGTLSARQGAWDAFAEGAERFWLLGRGAGADPYVLAKAAGDLGAYLSDFDASHNCLVYLLALAGLPGMIVFLVWFWRLLDAGMQNIKQASGGQRRALCWLAAAVGALFLAGTTGGVTFFAGFFWAWCGILERAGSAGKPADHQERLISSGEQKCDWPS